MILALRLFPGQASREFHVRYTATLWTMPMKTLILLKSFGQIFY